MIHWYQHLGWQPTLILAGIAVILAGVALCIRDARRTRRTLRQPRPIPVVDYSHEYQRKVVWLGSRYLLHKPINRRLSGTATIIELPGLARRQAQ